MLRPLNKLVKEYLVKDAPLLDNGGSKGLSMAAIKRSCDDLFEQLTDSAQQKFVLAILYLSQNHIESAAKLLSKREDDDTAYINGLIQRRLSDYALASYHFRIAKAHPALPRIAEAFRETPEIQPVLNNFPGILKDGTFHPAAMTGIVQQVCMGGHVSLETLIRKAQAVEMEVILRHVCGK